MRSRLESLRLGSHSAWVRRWVGIAGTVAWLAAALLGSATGCAGGPTPMDRIREEATPEVTPDTETDALADEPSETSGSEAESSSDAPEEPASKLRVRTLEVQTRDAREALERNFEGFLDREPLGFGFALFDTFESEAQRLADAIRKAPDHFRRASVSTVFERGIPFVVLAAFLAALALLSRQIGGAAHELQARIHLDLSAWSTRVVRGLILVIGRCLPVAILLVLSYFPVRAVFTERIWARAITSMLWLGLAYRVSSGALVALFSGRVLWLDDHDAARLERITVGALQIVFGFLVAKLLLDYAGYPGEVVAFVDFLFRLTLVAFPIVLYVAKSSVLELFPEDIESRLYSWMAGTIEEHYELIMVATALLFAMRAAGFDRSATFILVRGYGIVAMVALAFTAARGLRYFLRRQVDELGSQEEAPLETDRSKLTRRIEQLVGIGLGVLVLALMLQMLRLYEPTVILLRTPFVAIGNAKISFLSIIDLGFVILGTILAFKVLRATLNAKIYPLLQIDVGVAYAVNTIVKYILILVSFLFGMQALGVDLTALTVVLASLGVGIGFGLQTLVENLISGFIILFGQSVQKGDYITVDGTYGQVEAVGARSVVIKTPDNFEMLVPSKEIVSGRIINWSYDDNTVRATLSVGVTYDAEPEEVRDVLESVCSEHDLVLDRPEPTVRLAEFGDSSVNFELLFFFDCRETTERQLIGQLNFLVWDALHEADITIPFPQRDLNFKGEWKNPPNVERGPGEPRED